MAFTRRIRMEYYRVVYRPVNAPPNEPDQDFDFRLWLLKAAKMSLEARTFDYYAEQARLDRVWPDEAQKVWFLSFLRLRETNLPSKAKIDKEAEPIELAEDEYIGEQAFAMYDQHLGVLMLQRNRHSLGPSGIEEYVNLVWASQSERIYLRPIRPVNPSGKARSASVYRRITIRFADMQNKTPVARPEGPILKLFDALRTYQPFAAEVTMTMGHVRGATLDPETVKDSITDILDNRDIITKAEVGFKVTDDASVELVDLFAGKLHDFIPVTLDKRESLASEYVARLMLEKYRERTPDLVAAIKPPNWGQRSK